MWLHIVSCLLAQGILTQATTLVARVSVGGVMGTVTFSDSDPEQVTMTTNLTGPNVNQISTWELTSYRVNYDVADRCSASNVGNRYTGSASGSFANGDRAVSGVDLSGVNTIEGRSIKFLSSSGDAVACGTIESPGDYVTARATFRKKVLGHVTFRQQKASFLSLTRVTLDLYWDGSESGELDLAWRVVETGGCSTVGTAYNPGGVSGACDSDNPGGCAIGSLQDKLGMAKVGARMGTSRQTFVDLNLPLAGDQSVLSKTVQLFESGQSTPLACATIIAYATRTGVATFDNDGVTGTITMTQPSPLDPTTTRVDLNNLRSQAGGYHVHKYPLPLRTSKDESLCSGEYVSGHFNPFGVVYSNISPGPAASTEDMYEVGDLSKKYGLLNDLNSQSESYTDFNLPLFGRNSVLGRSIVIHYNRGGANRWICANLHDTAAMTSVLATFTFPVIGHVLMRQRAGEPEAGTSVYYRLGYGDGSSRVSSPHGWAVHAKPVRGDMLSEDVSARCGSTGDMINPQNVSDTDYSTCQNTNPLRCKMGDMTQKHGPISFGAGQHPAVGFFTDVNLPLQGRHSVVGRSLVLKASVGDPNNLACAQLQQVWPQVVEAASWGDGADYGSVTFTQQVGVVQTPTMIDINLKGVSAHAALAYSVRTRPVGNGEDRCSDLGTVYNPFLATSSGGSTKDTIAVGDLTAKFGPLAGSSASGITVMDPVLDLWGLHSVTGRALLLTSAGVNVGCAPLFPKVSGGQLMMARAEFTGEVTGNIKMMQYVHPNGAMTPTTVTVDLRKASGPQTLDHNWHTHQRAVGNDSTSHIDKCQSTGGHYNPFKVNKMVNYTDCKRSNPLRCELGDQSSKLRPYDMGSGPTLFTDVYLPLAGPYGVIGRSFVVHKENRGAPRLACADILPADANHAFTLNLETPIEPFNKTHLSEAVAVLLNTEIYNVAVEFKRKSECTSALIYFVGLEAEKLQEEFVRQYSQGQIDRLGSYRVVSKCSTGSAGGLLASVCLVLASLVLGHLM